MFKKVQFIGTAICTTPANLNSIEETSDDGYYAGLPDDNKDLIARLNLVKQSVRAAILSEKTDSSKETLKIFVLPEFFMRGVLGAYYSAFPYLAETILVEQFQKVLKELRESGIEFDEDYLFVLGTILSTKSKIDYNSEPDASLYLTGDYLLDVYYRLHPEEKVREDMLEGCKGSSMGRLLKLLDGKHITGTADMVWNSSGSASDDAYVDILKKTLDYCDAHASLEVGNRCIILNGADILSAETGSLSGSVYEPVIVQKKYKSKEDFILNYSNSNQVTSLPKYLQTTTKYYDIDTSGGENKKSPADGLAIFEYNGLKIGIDICLDHSRQRLVNHLYKHPEDYVDLQIVTSCGMSVRANAVIAKDGGIVFNCDGEYELKDVSAGVDGNCCHTSLERVRESISVKDNRITADAVLEAAYPLLDKIPCTVPEDAELYRFKDYQIHIYEPLNLE